MVKTTPILVWFYILNSREDPRLFWRRDVATKGRYPLHSQSIQAVFEKYLAAREGAHRAQKVGYAQIQPRQIAKAFINLVFQKSSFALARGFLS